MASLIAANVFLSSLKRSMTRVHEDKFVMVITNANLLKVKRVAYFIDSLDKTSCKKSSLPSNALCFPRPI